MAKEAESVSEKKIPFIDRWIKSMLVGRPSDGYPMFQEDFLRQGVKEFPFKEAQLFKVSLFLLLILHFKYNRIHFSFVVHRF